MSDLSSPDPITIDVINLSTHAIMSYVSLSPRAAVIAAYAQGTCEDWNTWDYVTKYDALVRVGRHTISCGDWCVIREGE